MGRAKRVCRPSAQQQQPQAEGESSHGRRPHQQCETEGRPETGEESSVLGVLSDDNILQILRNLHTRFLLSSPALVCRRWRRLCCSHLVLELIPSPLSAYKLPWGSLGEEEIQELARLNASTLEKVSLSGLKKPISNMIISLVRALPRLTELGLISCPLMESELEGIVDALPCQLTSLDLHNDHLLSGSCEEDCRRNTTQPVLNTFIQELQKKCPNLKHLDLDFCSYVSTECLDNLLLAIPHFRILHLQSAMFGWLEVSKILRSCTLLESVSIVSSRLGEEQDSSEEDGRGLLGVKGLRSRRQMFFNTGSQHPNLGSLVHAPLQSIRFYSSPHHAVPLDSTPLFGLLKDKGQQLRHLHAQSLYNTSWHTVSVWCANLQTLDLSHARAIPYSATGIEEVVLSGLPRLLKGLEKIGLPSVTDRVLAELGYFCPKLKEIHFEGHASASGVIQSQSRVTDRGVVALAEGCPDLQVISLAGCTSVTVASLRALAFHCGHLKALLLPGCTKINDDAMAAIWPRFGKSLLVLDLIGCKITSKTIRLFCQLAQMHGTSLVVLGIARSLCKLVKPELSELTKRLPSLRVLNGQSGFPWDGFFGSRSIEEMIPQLSVMKDS